MTPIGGRLIFSVLLAVELLLVVLAGGAGPARSGLRRRARLGIFLVPLAFLLLLRGWQALGVHRILDWDETYYFSLAMTAAAGRGLYPFIFGYGHMPIMGGIGWAAYLYSLVVRISGPTIAGLRVVSFAASLAALAGIWMLVRRWYGSGAAWIAAALTASLRLFIDANTIRMDAAAFAWTTWALYAAAVAWDHPAERRRQYLAGLVFGLGLEVHIDTVVTAIACCAVYVAPWIRARFASRVAPLLLFIAGELTGVLVYVCANILPDPGAFYRTTVLVRIDATNWYSTGTSSLTASFLSPQILVAKEMARYRALVHAVPAPEIALVLAAIAAAAWRRSAPDRIALTLIPAALLATAVVLNNAALSYFIHVVPVLIVPLAPLFTHGVTRIDKVDTADVRPISLATFAAAVSLLASINQPSVIRTIVDAPGPSPADVSLAARLRSVANRRCTVAGDGGLYVEYFADYPFFISTRPTEVAYGRLFYGATSDQAYWMRKQPDVVVAAEALPSGLASYIARDHLAERVPGVWMRPGGCRGDEGR